GQNDHCAAADMGQQRTDAARDDANRWQIFQVELLSEFTRFRFNFLTGRLGIAKQAMKSNDAEERAAQKEGRATQREHEETEKPIRRNPLRSCRKPQWGHKTG